MNFFGRRKQSSTTPSSGGGGGGGNKAAMTDSAGALQQMKGRIEGLEKRIEFLEKKSHQQLVEAKRLSQAKNKKGAMNALKRKKMFEKEIDKLRTAITNLESQAFAIENASVTHDIVSGMKAGKAAAEQIQKQINIDDVEDLKDDIEEQMQTAREIDDILSTPMGNMDDDDELLAELDELDEEDEDELEGLEDEVAGATLDEPPAYVLPKVPQGAVSMTKKVAEDDDEAALAALEAEMAM